MVLILFPLSTFLVVLSLASLPVTVSWPRTLQDLASMGQDLHSYSQSGAWRLSHVVGVLSVSAVWKHAWSVPGSVAWVSGFQRPPQASSLLNSLFLAFAECSQWRPFPPGLGDSTSYTPNSDGLYPLVSLVTTNGSYTISMVPPCSHAYQECLAWRFRFQLDLTK